MFCGVTVKSHLPSILVMLGISQKVPFLEADVPLKNVRPSLLHLPVSASYSCKVVVPIPPFAEPTMMYFLPLAVKKYGSRKSSLSPDGRPSIMGLAAFFVHDVRLSSSGSAMFIVARALSTPVYIIAGLPPVSPSSVKTAPDQQPLMSYEVSGVSAVLSSCHLYRFSE